MQDQLQKQKRQRKSKESRYNDFILSAKKVFAEKGYDAATIRDIAREAGCSDGLMFRYFTSKSELLIALIKETRADTQKEIESILDFNLNVEDQINKIAEYYIDHFKAVEQMTRVILSRALTDPTFTNYKDLFRTTDRLQSQVNHFLERQNRGEINVNYDTTALVYMLQSLTFVVGFHRQSLLSAPREECLEIMKRYINILILSMK